MKILLVTHNSFNKNRNNGKTLESLFSSFQKDDLAQLFFSQNEEPDWEYCDKYYQLTDFGVLKNFFGIKSNGRLLKIDNLISHQIGTVDKRKVAIFSILKFFFRDNSIFRHLLWHFWKSDKLFNWIEDIKPDAIFFLAGGLAFSYRIVLELSNRYSIPIITYFTDDYVIYPIYRNPIDYLWKKLLYNKSKKLINLSSLCFGIGIQMCDIYEKEFHKKFYSMMNSVDLQDNVLYTKTQSRKLIQFSYVGSLHLGRGDSLKQFAWILKDVMHDLNMEYSLCIYTTSEISQKEKKAFIKNGISIMNPVFGPDLDEVLFCSDILLHIEGVDKYYNSLARLSISTKIPEYLAKGKFILGYGPDYLASFRLLSDNSIGYVVSCELPFSQQKEMLKNILKQKDILGDYGQKARKYCAENFNKKNVSMRLKELILSVNK